MNISLEHKSYIIGFLHGDGNYSKQTRNRGKISIEIKFSDIDILDKIEKILVDVTRNSRIRDTNFKKNYKSCILSIFKLEIRRYLRIPSGPKANKIKPPKDVDLMHYFRGLYDADGSIGITKNNRPFLSLCTSSENIKNILLNSIKKNISVEKRLNRNNRDNVYNIVLYDEDAVNYSLLLYKDATIYLDRKYTKFLEIQKWKRTIPKRHGKKKKWFPYEDIIVTSNLSLLKKTLILNRSTSSIKTRAWRLKQT